MTALGAPTSFLVIYRLWLWCAMLKVGSAVEMVGSRITSVELAEIRL